MDLILWLDLETTGSDTSTCQVLEVGCVLTKGFADDLEVLSEFSSVVWPMFGEAALEEMPGEVQVMHRASGLWEACLADEDLTPDTVELRLLYWLRTMGVPVAPGILVAGGSGIDRFDLPIIERVFPAVGQLFHWRRMDVSSMKLLLNETGHGDLVPKQPGTAHRALDDAHWARTVALQMAAVLEFGPWWQRYLISAEGARTAFAESQAMLEARMATSGSAADDWVVATTVSRLKSLEEFRTRAIRRGERATADSYLARAKVRIRRLFRGDGR